MSSTGNVYPGTGETVARGSGQDWTNPGNIVSDNATDATCNAPNANGSDYLVARNFGFAIPAGSVILSVYVTVQASEHSSQTENLLAQLQDDSATLVGSVQPYSGQGAIVGTGKAVYTYGGTNTLSYWGSPALTPAIVNHANFGVRFWFATAHDVRIDYVTLAVEYEAPISVTPDSGALSVTGTAPTLTGGAERLRVSWVALEVPAQDALAITPTTGALVFTGVAPNVALPLVVAPSVGGLVFAGVAPEVTVSSGFNTTIIPTVGTLSLTGVEPSALTPHVAFTTVGALVLTGQAPSVLNAGDEQRLRVSWVALEIPAQSAVDIAPTTGALTFTGHVPSVNTVGQNEVMGAAGALTLTGYAPTALAPLVVEGVVGSMTLTGIAPAVDVGTPTQRLRVSWIAFEVPESADRVIQPSSGALTFTGYAARVNDPTLDITPAAGELVLTGAGPTQDYTLPSPESAVLTIEGAAPGVAQTFFVTPTQAALTVTGYAPQVLEALPPNFNVQPEVGGLVLEGYAPSIGASFNITPEVGGIVLTGSAPTVELPLVVATFAGELSFAGQVATLLNPENVWIYPESTELRLTGSDPGQYQEGEWDIETVTGSLVITGHAIEPFRVENRGAASSRSTRYTRKYVVEVDGQDFIVTSPQEVQALLSATKEAAIEVTGAIQEQQVVSRIPYPRIRVKGEAGPELTAIVSEVAPLRIEIREMYERAKMNAEIAYLIRFADEEDAIAALLM